MASFYSLDKVNDIADNDSDFIKVLVQTFLEEIPEDLEQLSSAVENNNKDELKYTPLFNLQNLELVLKAKDSTKEEHELILLIVLYDLRKGIAEIITEMQIADG